MCGQVRGLPEHITADLSRRMAVPEASCCLVGPWPLPNTGGAHKEAPRGGPPKHFLSRSPPPTTGVVDFSYGGLERPTGVNRQRFLAILEDVAQNPPTGSHHIARVSFTGNTALVELAPNPGFSGAPKTLRVQMADTFDAVWRAMAREGFFQRLFEKASPATGPSKTATPARGAGGRVRSPRTPS